MSVKYKLYQDKREDAKTFGKWYARAAVTDVISLRQISERIQRNCSMKASDVNAVLTELVEVMRDELLSSHRVVLDGFGSFKVGLRSKGADSLKDFSVSKNVRSAHINFLPAVYVDGATHARVKSMLSGLTLKEYEGYSLPTEPEATEG